MFEDKDEAGVVTLSASASFCSYKSFEGKENPALRRAEQRRGNSHDPYLITCATDRGDVLTLPEISQHDGGCRELRPHNIWFLLCCGQSVTYGFMHSHMN